MSRHNQDRLKVTYIHQKRKLLRNLDILKSSSTQQLVEIDLSENFIDNIQAFRIYSFQKLQILLLSVNFITNIEPFSHCVFPSLEKLYLFGNSIEDIAPLGLCGLQKLKQLRLGFSNRGNEIQDVSVISRADWKYLQELSLDCNNIRCIDSLANMNFNQLTHLYISNNHLATFDFNILNLTPHLKVLSMKGNYLTNIKFLIKCNLPELQYLNLSENNIVDIDPIFRTRFNKLQKLTIAENEFIGVSIFLKCEWQQMGNIIYCIYQTSKPICILFIGKRSICRYTRSIWKSGGTDDQYDYAKRMLVQKLANKNQLKIYNISLNLSLDFSRKSVEGDTIFNPSLFAQFFSRAEMESPSIRLSKMILIYWNCIIDLMGNNLKSHSIISPSLTFWLHCSIEVEPISSVGLFLIVMEFMEWYSNRTGIIRYVENNAVKDPSLCQHGICGKVKSPTVALYCMISVDRNHDVLLVFFQVIICSNQFKAIKIIFYKLSCYYPICVKIKVQILFSKLKSLLHSQYKYNNLMSIKLIRTNISWQNRSILMFFNYILLSNSMPFTLYFRDFRQFIKYLLEHPSQLYENPLFLYFFVTWFYPTFP